MSRRVIDLAIDEIRYHPCDTCQYSTVEAGEIEKGLMETWALMTAHIGSILERNVLWKEYYEEEVANSELAFR